MHTQFMLAALDQARLGRGFCAPNPSVGSVAVKDNHIIAQGYHHGAGQAHAEVMVLNQCVMPLRHVTLYVTLEPCNHWGKTPPCVDAIIQYGVERVVFGYHDPHPVIQHRSTTELLRAHGIDVIYYPLPVLHDFYRSYAHWVRTNKPWVTVKIAQSLDGKMAGAHGQRIAISNEKCARFTHDRRKESDLILTSAQTVMQDDPQLNVRDAHETISKPLALLDRQLKVPSHAQIWTCAQHCHVYHDASLTSLPFAAGRVFHPVPVVNAALDLHTIVSHLGSLGYHDVWVEAGAALFSALHAAHLVQQTYVYVAPCVIGDAGVSAYRDNHFFDDAHQIDWHIMDDNMIMNVIWRDV